MPRHLFGKPAGNCEDLLQDLHYGGLFLGAEVEDGEVVPCGAEQQTTHHVANVGEPTGLRTIPPEWEWIEVRYAFAMSERTACPDPLRSP